MTNPSGNVTIASSTAGSNSWYRALSLTVSGSDSHSGVSSIRYCTTTSSTCTPSTNINGSSTTVTLNSNARAQRVCYQVTDNSGRTSSTSCSNAYSVDTTNPTVSITRTSSTQDSISVTVSGSDSHSGIYQYRFSSNGGTSYTTITSSSSTYTYTFNNLNAGTTYNIRVQAVDRSGRTSSTASRSVATEPPPSAADVILANSTMGSGTPNFSNTSCSNGSNNGGNCGEETVGLYARTVNGETSYYFRGDVDDNWLFFAGFYWRIIRINGDGTIRLIYNGRSTTGWRETQIQTSEFNSSSERSEYVGLMYTLGEQHGTGTRSTIMKVLNDWSNIYLRSYTDLIDVNAGFCSDRNMNSGYTWSSTGSYIQYATLRRVANRTPSLTCSNEDLLTVGIGLITSDEVMMAGGVGGTANMGYYLYTGVDYWGMSPIHFGTAYAAVSYVNSNGSLGGDWVYNEFGVRPVINLRSDVTLSGSGTTSDPYTVS